MDLLQGKRLDKKDVRQALTIINEVSEEVKQGKRYILFPEGGYEFNNKNHVCDFKAGSFKIALKTKAPIVPVALILIKFLTAFVWDRSPRRYII